MMQPKTDYRFLAWVAGGLVAIALVCVSPLLKAHFDYAWIDEEIHPYEKAEAAENVAEAYGFYGYVGYRAHWLRKADWHRLVARNREHFLRLRGE